MLDSNKHYWLPTPGDFHYRNSRIWSRKLDLNQRAPASKAGGNGQTSPFLDWLSEMESNHLCSYGTSGLQPDAFPVGHHSMEESQRIELCHAFRRVSVFKTVERHRSPLSIWRNKEDSNLHMLSHACLANKCVYRFAIIPFL